MFLFVDGQPVVLRFNQVEQRYYAAFVDQFPEAEVSMSQWRGSYEYQTLYPAMQQMVENGALTLDALNEVLGTIAAANESIRRPAVLSSRVAERFKELGYEATSRVADATNKGIVAICVDQARGGKDYGGTLTPADGTAAGYGTDIGFRAGEFGELTPPEVFKAQVLTLTTQSAQADVIFFDFASTTGVTTFDAVISGITVTFYENPSYPGGAAFVGESADAYNAIRASAGVGLAVYIAGGGSFEAINDDDELIGNLIRDEMLPVGQHMEGDVVYETALSNGQPIDIKWTVPVEGTYQYRVTINRKRGSPYPENTVDEIVAIFNANYDEVMGIGTDITPQVYLTVRDLPWASSVLVEWYSGAGWYTSDFTAAYNHRFLATLSPANVVIV